MDLTSETFSEFGVIGDRTTGAHQDHDLPYEDLCATIDPEGRFQLTRKDGELVDCEIKFRKETSSYRVLSQRLNQLHPPKSRSGAKRVVTLTQQINNEQAFRVLIGDEGVVYTRRGFYETRDFVSEDGTVLPLVDTVTVPVLRNTISEKGETFFDKPHWKHASVLGVVKAICDGEIAPADCPLAEALADFDLVVLDDGGDEVGDFIAIGQGRVAIIHAKASEKMHIDAVTALQEVGRQAVASLAFCSTVARVHGLDKGRWTRRYQANDRTLPLSRLFRDPYQGDIEAIDKRIRSALTNPSISKEVWIVAGRLLNADHVRDAAARKSLSNRGRQLLMFIESLRTACGRANSRLRIFAHGDEDAPGPTSGQKPRKKTRSKSKLN